MTSKFKTVGIQLSYFTFKVYGFECVKLILLFKDFVRFTYVSVPYFSLSLTTYFINGDNILQSMFENNNIFKVNSENIKPQSYSRNNYNLRKVNDNGIKYSIKTKSLF